MKKFFIFAAAAIVALAACTKTEFDNTAYKKSRVINFNTVTGKATKAPITGNLFQSSNEAFGVFAYYLSSGTWASHTEDPVVYMDDVTVSFSDSLDIWAPEETYYWPLEGKLSFIAYWPQDAATASFSEDGLLALTGFTVEGTVADQIDLLYSAVAADKDQNESFYRDTVNTKDSQTAVSGGTKGVNIQFKHALSQIVFKAKTADSVFDSNLSFKVDSIVVKAATTADSMKVTNPATSVAPAGITTWVNPKTPGDFIVSGTEFPASDYLGKTLSDAIGDPLLMIPVTGFDATDPTITVKYTLYRTTDDQPLGSKKVTVHIKDVDDIITSWQAGKKYEYDLTIDLEKIYFTPSVIDWDASSPAQGVNVPQGTPYDPAA